MNRPGPPMDYDPTTKHRRHLRTAMRMQQVRGEEAMTTKRTTKKPPRIEWNGVPQTIVIEAALLAELVKK